MKRAFAIGIILCTLSSALCRAESSLTHDFDSMIRGGTLTWTSPGVYTVGNTDFVTYTGTNGGTFSYDGAHYVFSLPSNTSTLSITPVSGLTRIWMSHSKGSSPTWIKVYVSYNGSDWIDLSGSTTYSSTLIDAATPGAAEYYIKIVNEGSDPVNLLSIHYIYDPTPCNCVPYIAP